MAERRHVALLLQLEANLVDAARGIDGQHEREIDRLATAALCGGGDRKQQPDEKCTQDDHAGHPGAGGPKVRREAPDP